MSDDTNPPDPLQFTQNAMLGLHELDVAQANHIQWLRGLNRVLVCGLSPHPDDLTEDAHRRCLLGRWYYGEPNESLSRNPLFAHMGELHEDMHRLAARLLQFSAQGRPVDTLLYDDFNQMAGRFMTALRELQHVVIDQVCTVDHLTGVWNRHAMSVRLLEELSRVQRTGRPCTLGLMDIDFFKQVNDRYGHGIGDAVLQATVRFVKARLRSYDGLFRYGGEEFVLCLPDTDLDEAEALLNRIREEMAAHLFEVGEGVRLHLTASFGLALLDHLGYPEVSLDRADRALFVAKAEGRNRVHAWRLHPPA